MSGAPFAGKATGALEDEGRLARVLGAVFEQASTLGEALAELSRLLPLTVDGMRLVLVVNGSRSTVEVVVDEPALLHPRSAEHIVAMVAFAVRSRLRDHGSFGLIAHWSHSRPVGSTDQDRLPGVPVRFDAGWNGLRFDTVALRTVDAGCAPALDGTGRDADRGLHVPRPPGLVAQVREIIAAELDEGRPVSEAAVACQLALHPKSLWRRLAGRGTSFRRLVEDVRCDRSRRLVEAGRPVEEVALAVGYTDPTTLSRAFKRWTGVTPRAYAARARGRAPGPDLRECPEGDRTVSAAVSHPRSGALVTGPGLGHARRAKGPPTGGGRRDDEDL